MSTNPSTTQGQQYAATYQAGEDSNRLAETAKSFGLANARTPLRPVREALEDPPFESSLGMSDDGDTGNQPHHHHHGYYEYYRRRRESMIKFGSMVRNNVGLLFTDSTLEAARMHSVGTLAKEERVSRDGTLHLLSVSKRKKGIGAPPPTYGDLMDLFHPSTQPLEPMEVEVRETDDVEYEEVVVESVEGGTITAAVFGIVKGMVGPAVLYLPRGFAISGWAVALPATAFATLTYLYCSTRLLQAWKVESEKNRRMAEKMGEIQKLLEDVNGISNGGGHMKKDDPEEQHHQNGYKYGSIEEQGRDDHTTAHGIPEPTLLTYPELARRAFGSYSTLISGGIAAMQFGVCLTYLIFVPQNLTESVRGLGIEIPKQAFLIAMLALEIPLCWIKDIRKLAPFNIVATLLIAFGLASVLYIALFDDDGSGSDVTGMLVGGGDGGNSAYNATTAEQEDSETLIDQIARLPAINDTWFLFVGTSFFCFEGSITLLVPLQEAVYTRSDRERFPRVNNQVISSVVLFYMFFAIICWASFGDSVQTALTASLPEGLLSNLVQVAYSIAVIFTFPLQAFPALEVVTNKRNGNGKKKSTHTQSESSALYRRNVTASIIICFLGIVAILAIDYLGNVVSLLGSLVGIPIALIYPPLIHNKLVKDSSRLTRVMNYCLSCVGFVAAMIASYTTITSWNEGAE